MNRIYILLLCENCINLNYAELIHSAFQAYYVLLLCIFILLIFECLILKLQLQILIYLPKKIIVIYSGTTCSSVFSKSPVNVLSYFNNLKNRKGKEKSQYFTSQKMSWFRLWEIQPLVIMELEQSEKHRGASLWTCHARAESSQSSAPSLSSPRHPGGVAVDIQAWAVVFLTEENASLSLCLFQSEELHRGAESFLPPSKILSCWSPWVYAPLALPGSNPILSFDPLLWQKEKLRPVEEVLLVKSLRWVCTALASGSKVQGPRKALACFVMSDAIREHFVLPLTFFF